MPEPFEPGRVAPPILPASKMTPFPFNDVLSAAEMQWIFTEEELLRTPSGLDGMPLEKERENRGKGVNFIIQVGVMLKLPQLTLATASIFLHRFFMRYSMVDLPGRPGLHYYAIAATSLFLATKVEENCRKMRELVIACCRIAQKNPNLVIDEQSKEYWRWRDTILHNEDVLLEALCFDLSLEPPYNTLFDFLVYFGEGNNRKLRNAAWAFVNDSNLTMLCLLFTSRTVAAAAIYAAAKHCGVSFPDDPQGRPWWDILGVKLRSVRKACNYMAGVYENSPLKNGDGGGMYQRTPEDGDEAFAKTRRRAEVTASSPTPSAKVSPHDALEVAGTEKSRAKGPHNGEELENNANGIASAKSPLHEASSITGPEQQGLKRSHAEEKPEDVANGVSDAITNDRKANEEIPWGGETREERDAKRQKRGVDPERHPTEVEEVLNGSVKEAEAPSTNGTVKLAEESLSEEGEVEP
ncbi:hypothetical protein MMC16_000119 [Acarospora aff. strigata]|nr:hypothetical protein [Acarospora aff. strigata]